MNSLYKIKLSVLLLGASVFSLCLAGEPTAPASPNAPQSAMYTMLDICNYIHDNKIQVAKRTGQFVQPTVSQGTATGCSTTTIMGLLKGETIAKANWAGNTTSTANPDDNNSAYYSLKNICTYLDDSTATLLKRRNLNQFNEPLSAPNSSTGCSLNDIMGKIQFWAKVSDIAYLAFQAMNPFFNIDKSLAQPNQFFEVLKFKHATSASKSGVGNCPISGTFTFVFTDIDNDGLYNSRGDKFSATLNACKDKTLTADGAYLFELTQDVGIRKSGTATVRTDVQTEITFVDFSITTSTETNKLNGILLAHEQETGSDGNKLQQVTLTHKSTGDKLKVIKTNLEGYLFSTLNVVMITDNNTSEKSLDFDATVVLSESPKAGLYTITTTDIQPPQRFQLTTYEPYPYAGTIRITATSGDSAGLVSTAKVITLADANKTKKVEVKTDANGDGRIDSTKQYLWTDLSSAFN